MTKRVNVALAAKGIFIKTRSGQQRPCLSTGFSLIELLVVILIIGLSIRFVSINIDGNEQRQVLQEAKHFVNSASLIGEEAVLNRQQWGIDFYREAGDEGNDRYGYRWLTQQDGHWRLPEQQDEQEIDVLFSPGVQLRLEFDDVEQEIEFKREVIVPEIDNSNPAVGQKNTDSRPKESASKQQETSSEQDDKVVEPHVWMLSSGEMTAFQLFISNTNDPDNKIVINGDELGRVKLNTGAIDDEQF